MAAAGEQHLTQPLQFEILHTLATSKEETLPIEEVESWMTLVYKFLMEYEFSIDELMAKQVIRKSSRFALINGWLYKRSSIQLWLQCVMENDGRVSLEISMNQTMKVTKELGKLP